MATVQRYNLAFSTGAVAASLALASPRFAGGVALGALLETVNVRALWRTSERVFDAAAGAGPVVAGFGARFALLILAIGVALWAGVHPIGLLVGLSIMIPAVVVALWRHRPEPGPVGDAPAVPPPDDPSWDEWIPWLARERRRDPEDDDDEDEW
jgi:hypothetical protein